MENMEQMSGLEVFVRKVGRKLHALWSRTWMFIPRRVVRATTKTKSRKIAIMTNTFAYTCNPKYIYEELRRRDSAREIVWIVSKDVGTADYPPDARTIDIESVQALREVYSAEVWIDNGVAFSEYFERKPDQIHIQTMHGSLGIKRIDNAVLSRNKRGRSGRIVVRRESELTNYVITNSAFEEGVFRRAFWKKTPMVRLGHARTDPLFGTCGKPVVAIREDLKRRYGLSPSRRIALFAPTHRRDLTADNLDFGFARLVHALEAKFGGDWTLLVRFHSRTRNIRWRTDGASVVNVTDYPDMQELMMVTDVGITDYSSWIFDYVVTGRPGFIFASDADRYEQATGLAYPLEESPFPVAYKVEDLFANVENFDPALYAMRLKAFLKRMECVDDGHSASRIVDWMETVI